MGLRHSLRYGLSSLETGKPTGVYKVPYNLIFFPTLNIFLNLDFLPKFKSPFPSFQLVIHPHSLDIPFPSSLLDILPQGLDK